MTKPKMAEGSRYLVESVIESAPGTLSFVADGRLLVTSSSASSDSLKTQDAIRALYEGGPLRPLWDAAVKCCNWSSVEELVLSVNELRQAVDDMKEPTP